jgi:hypothetical protein
MPAPTLSTVRPVLRAIATSVVPESSSLDDRTWAELYGVIDDAVAQREPRIQRQLLTFLLASVERSPLLLIRRGFWGVRTLIFMGYYTRDDVAAAIGYRADPRGWTARGTTASVPVAPTSPVQP